MPQMSPMFWSVFFFFFLLLFFILCVILSYVFLIKFKSLNKKEIVLIAKNKYLKLW